MSTYGIKDQDQLAKKIKEKEGLSLADARKEALKRIKQSKIYEDKIAELTSQLNIVTSKLNIQITDNDKLKSRIETLKTLSKAYRDILIGTLPDLIEDEKFIQLDQVGKSLLGI